MTTRRTHRLIRRALARILPLVTTASLVGAVFAPGVAMALTQSAWTDAPYYAPITSNDPDHANLYQVTDAGEPVTCSTLDSVATGELKIDAAGGNISGPFPKNYNDGTLSIDLLSVEDYTVPSGTYEDQTTKVFSWRIADNSVRKNLSSVFVKTASGQGAWYRYVDPTPSGSFSAQLTGSTGDAGHHPHEKAAGELFTDWSHISFCYVPLGDISVEKVDTAGNPLAGATFELLDKDGARVSSVHGTNPCTTGTSGLCEWTGLPSDVNYTVVERTSPANYRKSTFVTETSTTGCYDTKQAPGTAGGDPAATCKLPDDGKLTFEFENPAVPYQIQAKTNDVNPIGQNSPHEFTVTLQSDPDGDGTFTATAGASLSLTWSQNESGDRVSGIVQVVDSGGTTNLGPAPGTASATCTTDASGLCLVTVDATSAASGTLTASFDTPYQHSNGTNGPTPADNTDWVATTGLTATIKDAATKLWRGYAVDIDEPATNLLGDDHTFNVTVSETGPNPAAAEDLDGILVHATWSEPTGATSSAVTGSPSATPVSGADAACSTVDGTCSFTVTSDVSGKGDLTIVLVEGQINSQDLKVGTHASASVNFASTDDIDTDKTWVEYRLSVDPPGKNQVGWDHTFKAKVESSSDGGATWSGVSGATIGPSQYTFTNVDGLDLTEVTVDDDDCEIAGTDGDGICDIVVNSTDAGTGRLTISGATIPWDGGTEVLTANHDAVTSWDNMEDKEWVDYGVEITPPQDTNLVDGDTGDDDEGDDSFHVFTLTASRSDSGPIAAAVLEFDWAGVGSIIDVEDGTFSGDSGSCTTADGLGDLDLGTCEVTVDSDEVGIGTLSVTKLTDGSVSDENHDFAEATFTNVDAAKRWVSYEVDVTPATDTNYIEWDHDFTVTVWEYDGYDDEGVATTDPEEDKALFDGADVNVSWSGPANSGIGAGQDATGSCVSGTAGTGKCTITVESDSVGTGTLSVTSLDVDTDEVTLEGVTFTTVSFDGVDATATGEKTWVDYSVSVSPLTDTNLVGQEHDFVVTAWTYDGEDGSGEPTTDPEADKAPAVGVTIHGSWSGDGDGLQTETCETTLNDQGDSDPANDVATCTFTVDSPALPGSGTFSVTKLVDDTVTHVVDQETVSAEKTFSGVTATKDWIAYKVDVEFDDVNVVDNSLNPEALSQHTFTVTIQRATTSSGGEPDWVDYDGTVKLDTSWNPTTSPTVVSDGCAGDSNGEFTGPTCQVLVNSTMPGTWVFSVDELYAAVGGSELVAIGQQTDVDLTVTDVTDSGTKQWVDYRVSVQPDDVNLTGDPHTFWVLVEQQVTEDGTWTPINGVDVSPEYTFQGSSASIDDEDETCTEGTADAPTGAPDGVEGAGWCSVTVNSTVPGTGVLTVSSLTVDLDDDSTNVAFVVPADSASKTWVAIDVEVDDDSVNHVDDDHPFDVDVYVLDGRDGEGDFTSDAEEDRAPAPDNTKVFYTWSGTGTDSSTCETTGTSGGSCTVTVSSEGTTGQGILTIDEVHFTHTANGVTEDFEVDLSESGIGQAVGESLPITRTKDWVDYSLKITPNAINLLWFDPEVDETGAWQNTDHEFTVTLTSSDTGKAPVDGQTIRLSLDSNNSASIVSGASEDADGFYCTTDAVGDDATAVCKVTVQATTPGTATLSGSYTTDIGDTGEVSFDSDPDGVKEWTTFEVTVTPEQAQNLLGTPHKFTVNVSTWTTDETPTKVAVEDVIFGTTEGAELELSPAGVASFVPDSTEFDSTCFDDGTDENGDCDVWITAEDTTTVTLIARYLGAAGEQTAVFSDSGDKTWIDYLVSIIPLTDENLIQNSVPADGAFDHTFEVTVLVDLGDGEDPIAVVGAHPEIEASGVGDIVGGTCFDDPEDLNDGTDSDGMCTVVLRSYETGESFVRAVYEGRAAGESVESTEDDDVADFPSETAEKLWVNYLINLTPGEAVNAIDDPHTFTATLLRDEGGDPFGAIGQDVTLTLTGAGTITAIETGEVDAGGRSGTCTTNESGQCTVTIVSAEAGTSTLTASYDAVVGTTSRTFTSDPATKYWIDIAITKSADLPLGTGGEKSVSVEDGEPDSITYDFTVTNPSDRDLRITSLVDRFFDRDDPANQIAEQDLLAAFVAANGDSDVLAAGDTVEFSFDHVITDEDIDNTFIDNTVTVIGEDLEFDESVSDDDDETVGVTEVLPQVIERPEPPAPAPDVLPKTGADTDRLIAWAVLMLALGTAVLTLGRDLRVVTGRRRRRD